MRQIQICWRVNGRWESGDNFMKFALNGDRDEELEDACDIKRELKYLYFLLNRPYCFK